MMSRCDAPKESRAHVLNLKFGVLDLTGLPRFHPPFEQFPF
jgi:hypothetical protein